MSDYIHGFTLAILILIIIQLVFLFFLYYKKYIIDRSNNPNITPLINNQTVDI